MTALQFKQNPPRTGVTRFGYRPELDGLRAISCVMVLIAHVLDSSSWQGRLLWLGHLQGGLGLGVFFVLSGYLITSLLLVEERRTGSIHLVNFYLRREFRLVPAYYVVLAAYAVIVMLPSGREYLSAYLVSLPYWLIYLSPPAGTHNIFGHSWSLIYEQWFYLLWPLFYFRITKRPLMRLAIVALLVGVFVTAFQWYFLNGYSALLIGCLVAIALDDDRLKAGRFAAFMQRMPTGLWLGLALLALAGVNIRPQMYPAFAVPVGLLMYSLSVRGGQVKGFLSSLPLRWLGKRSYSFYLFHVICLKFALGIIRPSTNVRAALAVVLSIALSAITAAFVYRFVERPARQFAKRLTSSDPAPAFAEA